MPDVNLKWNDGQLEPEDDDISSRYLLSRQVAHEYHSSAVQTYINAESAAQQAAAEAALDEQQDYKKEQSKKQAEGKAAESSFAGSMAESQTARQGETQTAHGTPAAPPLQSSHVTGQIQAEVGKETGGLEAPMVDPTMAGAAGAGATFKLSLSAGQALMPSLARAVAAGVVNTVTDPIYGTAAEVVGAASPELALPFNLAVGLLGGITIEPIIERGIVKAAQKAGKTLSPEKIAEQVQLMKGILANESGAVSMRSHWGLPETKDDVIEPWEITRDKHSLRVQPDNVNPRGGYLVETEEGRKHFKTLQQGRKWAENEHKQSVQEALRSGKPVSAEVLSDYPDLKSLSPVDDLTKKAVIEELNSEIGKHPVEDALRILKNQKGEVTLLPGAGPKSGTPKPGDMQAKSKEVLANTNPDITKETAGNIRLWGADLEPKFMGEIETPEDIMRVISGTHEAFSAETESARRGVRSWEETAAEAKKYKIEDLLGRRMGQALNAEQIDNARTLLVSSADTLRGMATLVRSGQANDLQKADFMRAFNTHYAIQMQLSGAAAEAGRALQIFRKVAQADVLRTAQLRDFMAATAANGVTPEKLADALSTMTTPAQVSNFVKQAKRATTYDMFLEAWINGLLSGPVTHAVNTTSNMLTALWMIPERALAAGLSRLHGGEIKGGEVAAQTFGLVNGFKDGLNLAWQALKKGESSDLMGKVEQQQTRAISAENVAQLPAIKKLAPNALEEGSVAARAVDFLGEAIRTPGRFLTAEDELFKSVGYRMELQAQAYRKASAEGLQGKAMAQRIRDIIADPQNLAPEVHLAAIDAARYQTFTKDLGPGGRAIQTAANKIPGMKLVVPFIRTPANIMKFAAERTPLAPLMKSVRDDIAAGGARRDMALARMSFGSMAMGVVASYAAAGQITGGGPTDTALRSHLYNTGWQPYSIKIGDKYYAYGRLEPIGMMMGLAADAVEIMGELDEIESEKVATTVVAAISKNVMSKTWLRGLSEMVAAMDDPDRYGSKYVKNLAGTIIPTGVAQIERVVSPELSDAQSALDSIKARIPGYSKNLPTRRNLWGEKIQFNGALGPDIISPIFTSSEKDSPIDKELLRMRAPIRMPSRTQHFEGVGIKLDPYEYEEFMVRMNGMKLDSTGKTLKKSLNELVSKDRDYKALKDDDQKERMIRAYIQEATEKTRAEMLEKSPTLRLLVDDEHRRQAAAQ